MAVQTWLESELEYGRKVLDAGLEGTRTGREAFLNGRPLTPFLRDSIRKALIPAAIGSCIGMIGNARKHYRSPGQVLAFGVIDGLIGFGLGMAWQGRHLAASAARSALKKISRVRDERWLAKHPIDYA